MKIIKKISGVLAAVSVITATAGICNVNATAEEATVISENIQNPSGSQDDLLFSDEITGSREETGKSEDPEPGDEKQDNPEAKTEQENEYSHSDQKKSDNEGRESAAVKDQEYEGDVSDIVRKQDGSDGSVMEKEPENKESDDRPDDTAKKDNTKTSGGVSASENTNGTAKNVFVKKGDDWVYYENGVVSKEKSDIVYGVIDKKEGWYYIEEGKAILTHSGVDHNKNGWWYVKKGMVDFTYNGFAKNKNGWWYIEDGKVTFKKNSVILGKVNGEEAWWNVKESKVVFNETIEQNENGWWYIKDGKVDFTKTSIEHNQNGWWYVKKGKVDFSYNGFAKNKNGWWYIENGKVTFTKNDVILGKVKGEEAWWNVKGSKVIFNETIEQNRNGWWYIKDGKVDFTKTSIEHNQNGWWYVKNGKVDFGFTGFAANKNGWWYVEKGKVTFAKNDVMQGTVKGENAWWNVKRSQVIFAEAVEQNKNGWWYIKDGKVDFGANGWRGVSGRDYYVTNGKVTVNTSLKLGMQYCTFDAKGRMKEIKYNIPRVINQRTTAFGNSGCGGAAALMALQATGYQMNANYSTFWSTVPRAVYGDFRTGYVPGVGITNPAYVNWIKTYAPATRYSGIWAVHILPLLRKGCTVILLVPSGSTTHFVVAYGYNYETGKYMIADPWGSAYSSYGITYTLTSDQIDYRLKVAAVRETGTREGIAVGVY